jgi:hypothetical protein
MGAADVLCLLVIAGLLTEPIYWAVYLARELWRGTWQR